MPRPPKTGLDYFQVDVDRRNDFKILDLLNEYGPLGYTVYDFCLQYIYANGYYFEAPLSQLTLLLVKDIGAKWVKSKDLVKQVIYYCADIGLFDHDLLQQNIMTSVGIQRRYNDVTARNKADKSKYWLLDKNSKNIGLADITVPKTPINVAETPINVAETPINVAETPINVAETQQEKRRVEKKREEYILAPSDEKSSDEAVEIFISIPLNDKSFYGVPVSDVEHYKELYPAVDVEQELRSMCGWCEADPKRRKTRKGIKRFINRWLSETQNRGGNNGFNPRHSGSSGNTSTGGYTNPNVL